MKKVFIHIGLPKTATSSIQSFLYDNKHLLHRNEYHYIQTGLSQKLKCHHDMIWKLGLHNGLSYVKDNIQEFKESILNDLRIESIKHADKTLILSSELLTFLNNFKELNPLLDIFKEREVFYIVNLRRQDKFLESLYQQVVKDGVSLTFGEWLQHSKPIANYNILINKLLKITDKNHIIIDIFDSRIKNLHPVENFLFSLGFNRDFVYTLSIENIIENESLSLEQIDTIRKVNKLNPEERYLFIEKFMEENQNNNIVKANYLSGDQRMGILTYFKESNNKLIHNMNLSPEIGKLLQTL